MIESTEDGRFTDGQGPDWQAIERSAAFRDLVRRRNRFVVPATLLALGWWVGFVLLVSYAQDLMGRSIYEGFTVAYALGISQFAMVWIITWLYLRKSSHELAPLERRVAEEARQVTVEPEVPAKAVAKEGVAG
jgi:uncharacterized membrane protein (DUF485 family)